jgi:hypothetical protein
VSAARAAVLWVAMIAFFVAALALLNQEQRRDRATFPAGSVFDVSPVGLASAQRYLAARADQRRARVAVLTQPIGLASLPADAAVFRMRPRTDLAAPSADEPDEDERKSEDQRRSGREAARRASPSPSPSPTPRSRTRFLTPHELAWVEGGGRLVLGLDRAYGPVHVEPAARAGAPRKVFPLWPRVKTLVPPTERRTLAGPLMDEAHTLFALGDAALVARWPRGRGEVLLLAAPELLDNAHLAQADHLALLEALAGNGRAVYFDEHAHGLGKSTGLLELLLGWGLGPTFVLGALALLLVAWRSRARLGPEEDDLRELRSEAVDLVDSLAQLYERTLSRREAARLYSASFTRAVALRTGLSGTALSRRVDQLTGGRVVLPGEPETEITPAVFQRIVRSLNDGFGRLAEHAHTR